MTPDARTLPSPPLPLLCTSFCRWHLADFYGASALLPLTDEEIVQRLKSHIATCEPGFKDAKVIDSAVLRFPKVCLFFGCFLSGLWDGGLVGFVR